MRYAWLLIFLAASPSERVFERYEDLKEGTAEAVEIRWDGTLRLAPRMERGVEVPEKQIWAMVRWKGGIAIAAGEEGKVYFLEDTLRELFRVEENFVPALAVWRGALYAGSAGSGKLYRWDGKQLTEVADAGAEYVWTLVPTEGGLFVGTGEPGQVLRWDGERLTAIVRLGEEQVRALAVQGERIWIGTAGEGRIYLWDGSLRALYDSDFGEIVALYPEGETVWALGTSPTEKKEAPKPKLPKLDLPFAGQILEQAQQMVEQFLGGLQQAETLPTVARPTVSNAGLLRVDTGGLGEVIWQNRQGLAYVLLPRGQNFLIATTEALYEVTRDGEESFLYAPEEGEITAALAEEEPVFGVSRPAYLLTMGPGIAEEGTYTSPVVDARYVSAWGVLDLLTVPEIGAPVECELRTGNTREPDETWSPWSRPPQTAKGRFAQWRCRLRAMGRRSPEILRARLSYLPANVAPRIEDLQVTRYGERRTTAKARPTAPSGGFQEVVQQAVTAITGAMAPTPTPKVTRRGWMTVSWKARDPNGDRLKYDLYYRRRGEVRWRLLKEGLTTTRYSWDTTPFADGWYEIRVVASDAPSNPSYRARTAERVSKLFVIDNTPPEIEELETVSRNGSLHVRFRVVDRWLPVVQVEYSVDGGDWEVVFPVDGIPDSRREEFAFGIPNLEAGTHVLSIRVRDQAQNQRTIAVNVEVK